GSTLGRAVGSGEAGSNRSPAGAPQAASAPSLTVPLRHRLVLAGPWAARSAPAPSPGNPAPGRRRPSALRRRRTGSCAGQEISRLGIPPPVAAEPAAT